MSATVTITLRPSAEAARRSIHVTGYWGEPIVFEDVKVDNWIDPAGNKPAPAAHRRQHP